MSVSGPWNNIAKKKILQGIGTTGIPLPLKVERQRQHSRTTRFHAAVVYAGSLICGKVALGVLVYDKETRSAVLLRAEGSFARSGKLDGHGARTVRGFCFQNEGTSTPK